jgi:hypothetical protein
MRTMSSTELTEHREATQVVRSCLSALRLSRLTDEDIAVAKARLENWLAENDGRWVA